MTKSYTMSTITRELIRDTLSDYDGSSPLTLNYLAELLHVSDDPQAKRVICSTIKSLDLCHMCSDFNKSTCNPLDLQHDDKTSVTTHKFGTHLMGLHKFFAQSERSVIWMYDEDQGIWKPNGLEFIQHYVAQALGKDFKSHNASEVQSYIRYLSYNQDVVLGGCKNKMVVANGVIDLEDGKFHNSFSPDDYQITAIPVTYDSAADCPKIKRFISEIINSEDDRNAIVEFFGYCLWKEYQFSTVLMLLGDGANGKSTLLGLLKAFLGQANISGCSPQELSVNRFRSAQLHGKLANVAGDIPAKPLEYTGVIKMLTGRDLITAEHKNRDPFDFENYAKLIFSANKLPAAYDDTDAFHRRFRLIDFPNIFPSRDPNTNPRLLEEMSTKEELSGLLNLAMIGWQRLRDQGYLSGERSTDEKRIDYVKRSDPLQYFAYKFIEQDVKSSVSKSEVYDWYLRLCHTMKEMPVSDNWFFKRLRRVVTYISESRTTEGDGDSKRRKTVWKGMRIRYDVLAEEGVVATEHHDEDGQGSQGSQGNFPLPDIDQTQLEGSDQNTPTALTTLSTPDKGYLLLVRRLARLWEIAEISPNESIKDSHLEIAFKQGVQYPDKLLEECVSASLAKTQHPGQWWLTASGKKAVVVESDLLKEKEGT